VTDYSGGRTVLFFDRQRELGALERFWSSNAAQCIPVMGRRRVGKTYLIEHFATGRRHVYFRCQLRGTAEQLPPLGDFVPGPEMVEALEAGLRITPDEPLDPPTDAPASD